MNKNNYDKKRSLTGYLMVSPAMILMLIFVFYPLVNLVYLSFFNYNLIGTKEFVGLKNYKILFFIKTDFIQALRNTGVYTLTVVIFSLLLAILLALWLEKDNWINRFLQKSMFTPYLISMVSCAYIWSWMYDSDSGVFNALLNALKLSPLRWLNDSDMAIFCVAAVAVWKSLGYYLIIVLASIKTVPRDILEAAELDRTPPLRKFIKITLESLNDVGFMDADGKGASCLDDGSMKQFLTDWYNWTEEGWCEIPALENASSAMQEDFYNGKLGAFVSSSNRATSISEKAQAAGINLGMSYTVGYGGYSAPLGGGSIGIIGKDHSQQEIAAAWEFVKFLMSDEQVAQNHIKTGVLPTTYSSVETDTLKDFWADEKNEGYKISYEQVKDASAPAMSMYTSEWNSAVRSVYSELIQARDITPDQALDNLKSEASSIFE